MNGSQAVIVVTNCYYSHHGCYCAILNVVTITVMFTMTVEAAGIEMPGALLIEVYTD